MVAIQGGPAQPGQLEVRDQEVDDDRIEVREGALGGAEGRDDHLGAAKRAADGAAGGFVIDDKRDHKGAHHPAHADEHGTHGHPGRVVDRQACGSASRW